MSSEPNTFTALGEGFVLALMVVALLSATLFTPRIGILGRILWAVSLSGLAICLVVAAIAAVTPGRWPVALSAAVAGSVSFSWFAKRARRRSRIQGQAASQPPRLRMRRWLRPIDYALCLGIFGAIALESSRLAAQGNTDPEGGLAAAVLLFIFHQITVSVLYRVLNRTLQTDYGAGRGAHYLLATLPVLLAGGIDVGYGVSFAGPLFRLALLAIAWRYTADRPTGVLKTLRALTGNWRKRPDAAKQSASRSGR